MDIEIVLDTETAQMRTRAFISSATQSGEVASILEKIGSALEALRLATEEAASSGRRARGKSALTK